MPPKHRFKVDKLVRDKIPESLEKMGVEVSKWLLDDKEYGTRLKEKLLEEATEVHQASTPQEIQEELADVVEVIRALAHLHSFTLGDIIEAANKKTMDKGGLEEKVYIRYVELAPDNPAIAYYTARPHQYPEMI